MTRPREHRTQRDAPLDFWSRQWLTGCSPTDPRARRLYQLHRDELVGGMEDRAANPTFPKYIGMEAAIICRFEDADTETRKRAEELLAERDADRRRLMRAIANGGHW